MLSSLYRAGIDAGVTLATDALDGAQVVDLTPLEGMELEQISLPPRVDRGTELLRRMPSLRRINKDRADRWWTGEFKGWYKP